MFYFKLNLSVLILIAFNGLITCTNEKNFKNNVNLNKTVEEIKTNVTNLRTGRALMPHSRTPSFTLRRRQPITIRARADHFPLRTQIRRVYNGLPNAQPQQQTLRFSYDSLKSSKYLPSSKVANAGFLNNVKGSVQRPQLLGNHPNSIHVPALSQQYIHNFKASPQFNGQVVVHPVTQKQTPVNVKQDYPKYVKPQQQQSATNNAAASQSSLTQYPEFKQYPIPDQEKMQKYNEQHEKYLQQQKYLTPKNPIAYYQLQQQQKQQDLAAQHQTQLAQPYNVQQPQQYLQQTAQQQQQQPMIPIHENAPQTNNVAFPAAASVPPKMYSVYEDNDMTELQNNNYQTVSYQGLDKEAQEYLRFMNTNEYFLPKKDPNYKQLDEETDKHQYNVLKAQQQQHLYTLQHAQAPYQASAPSAVQTSYEQQAVYAPSSAAAQTTQYSNSLYADLSDPASYSQNHLFNYEHEPSPSASSTVVRTSYQTGFNQNQIHINSKDNRLTKYSTPKTIVGSTTSPLAYSQLRHNAASSAGGSRTPEPLRFEFTERDAMIGGVTYTRAPQTQLRYGSNSVTPSSIESSTVSSLGSKYDSSTLRTQSYAKQNNVKQANEDGDDDPEDGDDMEEAGNNLYGRQPVASSDSNKSTSTTETPPSEQKDTEEYCERICAIVEDENEEIVCGSDGYMYTSEAQMECYASCLHIDVTIQGKGSCSTR